MGQEKKQKCNNYLFFSFQLRFYVCHDFGFLIRMKPDNIRIPFKPRHLLAGINPAVAFNFLDGKVERPFAVKVVEEFFVTNRIQRVQMAERIYAACFFQ